MIPAPLGLQLAVEDVVRSRMAYVALIKANAVPPVPYVSQIAVVPRVQYPVVLASAVSRTPYVAAIIAVLPVQHVAMESAVPRETRVAQTAVVAERGEFFLRINGNK